MTRLGGIIGSVGDPRGATAREYVWQRTEWPSWRWDAERLLERLGVVRRQQGRLLADGRRMGLETRSEVLFQEALSTSAIEGERLNEDSLRSSIARRLGLSAPPGSEGERATDGVVAMLLDAAQNFQPLTADRLLGWHAALFPTGFSGLTRIAAGQWRSGALPMQVASGPIGREKVHFEAVPSSRVPAEMERWLEWVNATLGHVDGLVRAAVAHFWFVTIHPFEDGNGRVGRALAEMLLAQDEGTTTRLYALSAQILAQRNGYYLALERAQLGDGDLTEWVLWFLEVLEGAIVRSQQQVTKAVVRGEFWSRFGALPLNSRQRKVLDRLLEAGPGGFVGGLTNRKYCGLTHCSPESAKRDVAELVALGLLARNAGGGRSTSYSVVAAESLTYPDTPVGK